MTAGRGEEDTGGLDPSTESPFYDVLKQALIQRGVDVTPKRAGPLRQAVIDVVTQVKVDVRLVGFWHNPPEREQLRRRIIHRLDETRLEDGSDLFDYDWLPQVADRLMELARANHHRLVSTP